MTAALECLDQALAIDPVYAQAMAAAAYCRAQCHFQGWTQQDDTDRAEAVRMAWRSAELAPNDAQILWMAAFAVWNMARTERERAREMFSRSLLINPNSAMALTLSGWIETMCGNLDAGRAMVMRAQRLNPRDPRGWLMAGVMAIAAVVDEDYAAALSWAERALAQNRRFAVALRVAAVAHVRLGRQDRARQPSRRCWRSSLNSRSQDFSHAYRCLWNEWRGSTRMRCGWLDYRTEWPAAAPAAPRLGACCGAGR
jgi:tetratricopeptide (TPR) repeat protein